MSASQEVIPAAEVRAQEQERVSLLATFAHRYGLEANNMMRTLRATVLRPAANGADPSNEQVAAFMIVANQHELNPFTKEIHGFVDKRGGIVPIVGVDGWAKLANQHPQFDGMDFEQNDESCTCKIYRKDRAHPIVVTEYLSECKQGSPAWTSHPKRMLRHRAMVQAMRLAFSFAGVYDADEGESVLAAQNQEIDVTPDGEMTRGELGEPRKVSSKKLKDAVEGIAAAVTANDGPALLAIRRGFDNEEWLYIWGKMRSYERTPARKLLEAAEKADQGVGLDKWSVELLNGAAGLEALQAAWKAIQDAYADNDAEVPADIDICYQDRKRELGAVS
jgi:phage recombination protein Bet